MNVGDYIRFGYHTLVLIEKVNKIEYEEKENKNYYITENDFCADKEHIIKSSPDITDLLQPMDLIYVDIDDGFKSGIIVPRIAETQAELNLMINLIKSGKWILKGVVTSEQLDSMKYKVGE